MKKIIALVFVACLILSGGTAHALSVLADSSYMTWAGVGKSGYSYWTNAVSSAFGGNVTLAPNFEGNNLSAYDAIVVNLRSQSFALTDVEVANLKTFISGGGRVVMLGDNSAWQHLNTVMLGVVGGIYGGSDVTGEVFPASGVDHELLEGVESVLLAYGTTALGGTSLFNLAFANLWEDGNVLTLQDINFLSNNYWGQKDNGVFATNIANWLAAGGTPTPIPGAVWLLGSGLLGLAGIRWKRRA